MEREDLRGAVSDTGTDTDDEVNDTTHTHLTHSLPLLTHSSLNSMSSISHSTCHS